MCAACKGSVAVSRGTDAVANDKLADEPTPVTEWWVIRVDKSTGEADTFGPFCYDEMNHSREVLERDPRCETFRLRKEA